MGCARGAEKKRFHLKIVILKPRFFGGRRISAMLRKGGTVRNWTTAIKKKGEESESKTGKKNTRVRGGGVHWGKGRISVVRIGPRT